MTGAAEPAGSHVYVYGFARAGGGTPPPAIGDGVVPDAPVQLLPVGGLSAIVSVFPAGTALHEFGQGDEERAKSCAVAHHRVLEALAGRFPLAPSKFGTVLRSLDDLNALMQRNAAALRETLDHVAGCREWGLKLFGDPSIFRAMAQSGPALTSLQEELASASSGKAYFIRKKLQSGVEAETQRMLTDCAIEVHQRLASAARESAHIRSAPAVQRGCSGTVMLLNTAYLVEKSREAQFHEALTEMRGAFAEKGLSDALTGPWPPYNFVSLQAGGTDRV